MGRARAGMFGGLLAGVTVSVAMALGRRTGLLHKTLAEDAEDWLDRVAGTRRRIGAGGTTALEEGNHLAASAAFGFGYTLLRARLPRTPSPVLGALYGAGLYAVNIAGVAPLIGLTQGERNVSAAHRAERLGVHLLFGILTALAADGLSQRLP